MPRSLTRILVLLAMAATVSLTQLTPASAELPDRCGVSTYAGPGLTLKACISADLSYVRGRVELYINQEGVDFLKVEGSRIDLSARIELSAPPYNTGNHYCPYNFTAPGVYSCSSYAARTVHGLTYFTVGSLNRNTPQTFPAASPRISP